MACGSQGLHHVTGWFSSQLVSFFSEIDRGFESPRNSSYVTIDSHFMSQKRPRRECTQH